MLQYSLYIYIYIFWMSEGLAQAEASYARGGILMSTGIFREIRSRRILDSSQARVRRVPGAGAAPGPGRAAAADDDDRGDENNVRFITIWCL